MGTLGEVRAWYSYTALFILTRFSQSAMQVVGLGIVVHFSGRLLAAFLWTAQGLYF